MKSKPPLFHQAPSFPRLGNRRGIALVSVLAVLILLTVLVVAFLIRAEMARTSSANYRATTGTRLLTDTVLNLVQAEINDATTYGSSTMSSGSGPYTWASQPGAVRVFDSTGALQRIYRLYSAPSLTTNQISDLLDGTGNTTEVPTTWAANPAQWVDLNAPVSVTDPTNAGNNFTVYPILDNRCPANTAQCVQLPGFFVNPVGTVTFPVAATTTLNPPYMPVRWLYVLQNGQLVAPTGGAGTSATFTGSLTPSSANPIVGRVAFWTDDDTCKVNINTAAGSISYRTDFNGNTTVVSDGGVFFKTNPNATTGNSWAPSPWDVPRYAGSWDDVKMMAADQTVQGEYQRYPGHPATTILYYILRALGVSTSTTIGFAMPEIVTSLATFSPSNYGLAYTAGDTVQGSGSLSWPYTSTLFGILPRYNDNGGSQGGIADTTHSGATIAITPNRSRLYTSVGELLYSTSASGGTRTKNGLLTLGVPSPTGTIAFTRQQIETGKFFLTAHSRAPETTLFGTPRVAMWPIPDTTQASTEARTMTETALDKLIAFCSTTDQGKGGTPAQYYFKRYDRASPTNDYNNEPRNKLLYGYLQDLTAGNIPGYGGNFLSKYQTSTVPTIASERDQILTEMIDYIRCTNLNDHSNPTGINYATDGEVIPLQITQSGKTTSGLGRLLTLSEIGLHVICTADGTNNLAQLNGSNTNLGYSSTITGSSVTYCPPQLVTTSTVPPASFTVSTTVPVSPVIGSASDPAYVSNLPVAQFLRDSGNNIVDIYGNKITSPATAANVPFPANYTLTTTGSYSTNTANLAALPVGSKQLQAMLIFEPAAPMNGFDQITAGGGNGPDVNIQVTNIQNIAFQYGPSLLNVITPFPNRTDTSGGPLQCERKWLSEWQRHEWNRRLKRRLDQ